MRELVDVVVERVDLVGTPANKKRFLLVKSQDGGSDDGSDDGGDAEKKAAEAKAAEEKAAADAKVKADADAKEKAESDAKEAVAKACEDARSELIKTLVGSLGAEKVAALIKADPAADIAAQVKMIEAALAKIKTAAAGMKAPGYPAKGADGAAPDKTQKGSKDEDDVDAGLVKELEELEKQTEKMKGEAGSL